MPKFVPYGQGAIRPTDPVRGEDASSHTWNTDHLWKRPLMVHAGPKPQRPDPTTDWPREDSSSPHLYAQRWVHNTAQGEQTYYHDSFMTTRSLCSLEVHALIIGVHLVGDFKAEDWEQLEENRVICDVDFRARFRQLGVSGTSGPSYAQDEYTPLSFENIIAYPTDITGISRFLVQARHAYFDPTGGKPTTSENAFTYREGQLFEEDFALVRWIRFRYDLPPAFDPDVPIRFDLMSTLNSADFLGNLAPAVTRAPNRIRLYCVGSSIYERGR